MLLKVFPEFSNWKHIGHPKTFQESPVSRWACCWPNPFYKSRNMKCQNLHDDATKISTSNVLSMTESIHARRRLSKSNDSRQDLLSLLEFVQQTADDVDRTVPHHILVNHIWTTDSAGWKWLSNILQSLIAKFGNLRISPRVYHNAHQRWSWPKQRL